jgi:hypothetical protein
MQITLKNRETISAAVTAKSVPIDVSDSACITAALTVYVISGTSPQIQIQFETSNDMQDWVTAGTAFAATTTGTQLGVMDAKTDKYQRYVRASIVVSGTTPLVNFSLWVNTFASS